MTTIAERRGTRYPATVRTFARRLYDQGYSVSEVRHALARQGYTPDRNTVHAWCDPEFHERRKLLARFDPSEFKRRTRDIWWAKWRRMKQMRDAGLSFTAIATMMELDFDVRLTPTQVRYMFNSGGASARQTLERNGSHDPVVVVEAEHG